MDTEKQNFQEIITDIYSTFLKRIPVKMELDHYGTQLKTGNMTVDDVVNKIKKSTEYLGQQSREIQFINKYSEFKEPFFEIDKKRTKNKIRVSQLEFFRKSHIFELENRLYVLKKQNEMYPKKNTLEIEYEKNIKLNEIESHLQKMDIKPLTIFQKDFHVQGPAALPDKFNEIKLMEKRKALEDFIIENTNERSKVLDAGCNTGVEGYLLYTHGFKGIYVGNDSNLQALNCALDNLEGAPASFVLSDISMINYPDNYFDIVFTQSVLEGLEYYEDALSELTRLTSKYLIICPWIYMTNEPDLIKKHMNYDVYANRYNRTKLYQFLEKLGLSNPKIIYHKIDEEREKNQDAQKEPLGPQEIIVFEKSE